MLRPEVVRSPSGDMIECPAVLLPSEVTVLKAHGGSKILLLITWAMHVFRKGMKQSGCGEPLVALMQQNLMDLRAACGFIQNTLKLPMPFAYAALMSERT